MKKFLLFIIFLLIVPSIFPQQKYYTFSELKGMEDNSGNTHLFYRLHYYYNENGNIVLENSIYHLDLSNNIDSLFLFDGGTSYIFSDPQFVTILDYKFWDNNPAKYIYLGVSSSVDPVMFIKRFDESNVLYSNLGEAAGDNIEISNQNDSLLFTSVNGTLLKSINGGISWDTVNSMFYGQLISLSPFNDSILFANNYSSGLYKSVDRGNNFSLVDTFYTNNPDNHSFYFDEDETHIYRIISFKDEYFLSVSNNKGNAFSWTQKYSSSNKLLISVDNSQSGSIYLSDGNYIFHSIDYGENFSTYKKLDRKIVGIYKKPNSNKLYAATKYDLYEITSDTIKTIKHLQIDPDVFSWFPLHVGDKWIYDYTFTSESEAIHSIRVKNISKKFLYENKEYYIAGTYYRIDSASGKIYEAYFYNDTLTYEELFLDLLADIGDTLYAGNGIYLESETQFSGFGINSIQRNFKSVLTPYKDLRIVKNLGIFYDLTWELVGSELELKGAVINGIVYGDTTITSIEESDDILTSFSLSQNYPNPFNPTTKIKYAIPVSSPLAKGRKEVGFITLKVYDILGKEIVTLVNQKQSPGNYEVEFSGNELSSGIYFYTLTSGSFHQTRKMILIK